MSITVKNTINASLEKNWLFFTSPEHITNWNFASADWYCPKAENDLKTGGRFNYRMAAKDDSAAFDFEGTYNEVVPKEKISYTLDDNRKIEVMFKKIDDDTTEVIEIFESEKTHSETMQQNGWQAILDNFKLYTEAK